MSLKSKYSSSMREEELKNRVAKDWFSSFDCSRIIGNIDFCVDIPATELALGYEAEPALWAEAKAGVRRDIVASFVQLILTIGGAHTADRNLPPHFLGAFDAEKIAFLPYNAVLPVLGKNDFDWTVAPSDHESKEFKELYALAKDVIEREKLLFRYVEDAAELRAFIKKNFKSGRRDVSKILINKNNFTHIYRQWRDAVLPHIEAPWDVLKKKYNIYDRDFYLAEMNIDDNGTSDIADDRVADEGFYISFNAKSATPYTIRRKNEDDLFNVLAFGFRQGGLDAYSAFWRRYKRPPKKVYWNFIKDRIDLLVPQDVRERKGSFFTPQIWVEKSQQYLAAALGENWQDEYDVWDCCCGTGNLEVGLTNKYRIWASTIDQQDIDVIHDRIKGGANLLDSHVFQFDFLNDSFDKLPQGLRDIINDPERRKKLVVYINPPYAEVSSKVTVDGGPKGKRGVNISDVQSKYAECLGTASRELFAQFLMRITKEIKGCTVGQFSKIKHLQGAAFATFRKHYTGELLKVFLVPADTFDNVKGKFPIGFFVWRLGEKSTPTCSEGAANASPSSSAGALAKASDKSEFINNGVFTEATADVYDRTGAFAGIKTLSAHAKSEYINAWISCYKQASKGAIGFMDGINGNDFQHNSIVYIVNNKSQIPNPRGIWISAVNIQAICTYFAVRHCVEATWLNDRDNFLVPDGMWSIDIQFQSDCLVYTLFSDANVIKSAAGVNHWIPFTEAEVGAKDCFKSHFMSEFLNCGNMKLWNSRNAKLANDLNAGEADVSLANGCFHNSTIPQFHNRSPEASAVLDAGRELWRYYHSQPDANPDASYYDIRLHFQGATVDANGKSKMNALSSDATYTRLLGDLRAAMKRLAATIEPKVYEYGFLKK